MDTLISVKNLRKTFDTHTVLDGISFDVKKGSVFALLGANGAGKTTTINILSTLLLPDSGELTINGHDVVADDQAVRSAISVTGQYAAVDELLTGRENMHMLGQFSHLGATAIKQRTEELLDRLDLQDAANRRVSTYSGGMRRRLDLAISLLAKPPLIFLDEPTTGLDPRSRKAIWELISELVQEGATIFLTTQYLEEADHLADTIAVLNDGLIVASGTPEELKQHIGKDVAEITFSSRQQCDAAKKILSDDATDNNSDPRSLSIAFDGTARHVRQLLTRLADSDCEPDTIRLRKPTIDDVFLTLTDSKQPAKGKIRAA